MRKRSRYFAFSVIAVLLAMTMVVGGCTPKEEEGKPEEPTKDPIKIGAVVSLSGTYAGLGEPEKAALEMEVAKINADGGVNGHPIELIIEDDATDEAQAVAATAKLIEQDGVVAIIGATGTGQSMGMRADVEKAMIPQVSMAGGTVITSTFSKYVFQTPWSNTLVVPFTLQALKDAGITKIGLITDSGGFGKDGVAVIEGAVGDYGITIAANETFNPGDTDMTSQLTKIKDSGAEAIVMWTAGAEAATIAKNREQLKIDLPFYGSHGNARVQFIEGAGTAAEGFMFPAGKILLPESYGTDTENYKVATQFIEDYKAATGTEPNTFAGHAYDALYLIVNAAKTLDEGFTPEDLRMAIEATDGFVGIGGVFTFSETDHNGLSAEDVIMYKVVDGAWTLAE